VTTIQYISDNVVFSNALSVRGEVSAADYFLSVGGGTVEVLALSRRIPNQIWPFLQPCGI
jgi:hypothetical protein